MTKLRFDDIVLDVMSVFHSIDETPAALQKQNIVERNKKMLLAH
jgi:hypothetical protein